MLSEGATIAYNKGKSTVVLIFVGRYPIYNEMNGNLVFWKETG